MATRKAIVGSPSPSVPAGGVFVRIQVAKWGKPVTLVTGCSVALGRWVHFRGRGMLCSENVEQCNCALRGTPRRWYAFLVGWDKKDNDRAVLQIPWRTWEEHQFLQQAMEDPEYLLSRKITATRMSEHPRAKLILRPEDSPRVKTPIPAELATQWLESAYSLCAPKGG